MTFTAADAGPAYQGVRERLTTLLASADPGADATVVPHCPGWSVRQVVAHLAGACEDILEGRLDGVASEEWTDAQVRRHADEGLADLLDRWSDVGPQVEAITGAFPTAAAAQFIFDAVTHEHDLRHALGAPGARDSDAVGIATVFLSRSLGGVITQQRLPALALHLAGREDQVLGGEPSAVTLTATPFEFVRSFGGRRSEAQIRALHWDGDPSPYLSFLEGILTAPSDDIVE